MNVTSKTGLLASPTKQISFTTNKTKPINLKVISQPASVALRPYAGLYNPFSCNCSLLCNHPTDREAKEVLRRARETWATENRNILLPDELKAIRESFTCMEDKNNRSSPLTTLPSKIECIPEELFRRYTDTDSRPLTPAPTVASVRTRSSNSRRCITPDPVITSVLHERTLLILDLRRSHSQEIISWQDINHAPLVNVFKEDPTPSVSTSESPDLSYRRGTVKPCKTTANADAQAQIQKLEVPKIVTQTLHNDHMPLDDQCFDGEEEIVKRKGKRRKKRGRDSSKGPLAVQASIDPETQISTCDTESSHLSARPSLIPSGSIQNFNNKYQQKTNETTFTNNIDSQITTSILESHTLKHLQRELNDDIVDLEFDETKRATLAEAYKILQLMDRKHPCDEMLAIQSELNLSSINVDLWLSLPRVFSRSAIRFELPLHSRTLQTLKPLEYLRQYCTVSKGRKLLYNLVFNRHRNFDQEKNNRTLCIEKIPIALGEMMGRPLNEDQILKFRNLVNWKNYEIIDLKTWCGMCALFERIFASEFCSQLPSKEVDPCNEIEISDFQSLSRRLQRVTHNENLIKILNAIKEM